MKKFRRLLHMGTIFHVRTMSTRHLIADSSLPLSFYISQNLNISTSAALGLIKLGSVYCKFSNQSNGPIRQMSDTEVHPGDYVRIYPNTTRYDIDEINWNERIIFCNDDWVVIDKPAGCFYIFFFSCRNH